MQRLPLALVAAVFALGCAREHEHLVHVIAEEAPGLKKSARVQFRGIDVGYVKQVYFTPGGVRIDLVIERRDAPMRERDTVRLTSVGTFGQQVVDIQPGDPTARLLIDGVTLPKVQPESTVALPVSLWRSMVRTLGITPDSAARDTTKVPAKETVKVRQAP